MKRTNAVKAGAVSLLLFAFAGATTPAWGGGAGAVVALDEQHDAKAIEVIEKSIEAIGGREAISNIKHMTQTGTISVPMAGLNGTMDIQATLPDKFLMVITLPGMGEQRQGLNGDIAWSIDPMGGPRILPEAEAESVREQADMSNQLKFKENNPVIAYEGEVEFDGKAAHKIRLVDTDGDESIEYYAADSGYMIGNEMTVPSQMGDIKTISYLREYKDMGGIMTATKMVQKIGPQEVIFTIKSTNYDEVDESVFVLPDSIKALAEVQKKEESVED